MFLADTRRKIYTHLCTYFEGTNLFEETYVITQRVIVIVQRAHSIHYRFSWVHVIDVSVIQTPPKTEKKKVERKKSPDLKIGMILLTT